MWLLVEFAAATFTAMTVPPGGVFLRFVMGHEAARTISAVGEQVSNLGEGDRVTFDSSVYPENVRRAGAGSEPRDLDSAIVFLAAESSPYVTGQTLLVDGGISTGATRALPKQR